MKRVAQDSRGNTLFVEQTEQGACYWSDEIGGGVMVWHTALVSAELLRLALAVESADGESVVVQLLQRIGELMAEADGLRAQGRELVTEIKIRDGVISDLQSQLSAEFDTVPERGDAAIAPASNAPRSATPCSPVSGWCDSDPAG